MAGAEVLTGTTPVSTRAIRLDTASVIHTLPSAAAVMPIGCEFGAGTANACVTPAREIRQTCVEPVAVNHRFPSAPVTIWFGCVFAGNGNSAFSEPAVVI